MNGWNFISRYGRRCVRLGIALLLLLVMLATVAEAQKGKKAAHDKGKAKSTATRSVKKSDKSVKKSDKKGTKAVGKSTSRKNVSEKKGRTASTKRTAHERSTGRDRAPKQERTASRRHSQEQRGTTTASVTHGHATSRPQQPAAPPAPPVHVESGPADLALQTLLGTGGDRPVRTKRSSPAISPLSGDQLQAIATSNQEIEPVTLRGYPEIERPQPITQPFYAEGSIGVYTTAALRAGFYGSSWPYDYSLHANASSTNGFVDNATKLSLGIGGRAGYVIGEGYGIFSGGHMGGDFDYGYDKYRRYAIAAAPERTRTGWNVGANGQNSYDGTTFELKGGYSQLTLNDSGDTREGSLDGDIKLRSQWNRFTVGGEADVRLTNLAGTSISFGRLEAYARYSLGLLTLKAGGSFGVGGNSDGSTETKLAPLAEIDLIPFYGVSISAGVTGGVTQNTLRGLLELNPYVVQTPLIRHETERLGFLGSFRFEPWQSFGLRLSGSRGSYTDYAYFVQAPNALFAPAYGDASVTKATGDFYLDIGKNDMLAAQGTFMEATLDATGARILYVPKWDAELMYLTRLSSIPLTLTATARYIGPRDIDGGAVLAEATLLGLKGRYAITSHFDATLELSNLINETYEIWPGYQERGFFGAVGIGIKY